MQRLSNTTFYGLIRTFGLAVCLLFLPHLASADPEAVTTPDVVYLSPADVSALRDDFRYPPLWEILVGATPVTSWDALQALDDEHGVDVLLLDSSMVDQIDADWLSAAYHAGMVVVAFNLPVEQLAELTDDDGLTRDSFAAEAYPGNGFIVTSTYRVACEAESDRQPAPSYGGSSASTYSLDSAEDVVILHAIIQSEMEKLENADALCSNP
jgi:hypothetical protein